MPKFQELRREIEKRSSGQKIKISNSVGRAGSYQFSHTLSKIICIITQPMINAKSVHTLVKTAVTFYMLQACTQGNFL